jgi:hypothetical protein
MNIACNGYVVNIIVIKSSIFCDVTPYSPLSQVTFQKNTSPLSSRLKSKPSKTQHEAGSKQSVWFAKAWDCTGAERYLEANFPVPIGSI